MGGIDVICRWPLVCVTSFASLASVPISAQTTAAPKTFDVASVKRSAPNSGARPSIQGGPGTASPGEFVAANVALKDLLIYAFGLRSHEFAGPAWLSVEHYDLRAKVPAGTTKDDLQAMLQSLLVERFALRFHREQRPLPGYVLTVDTGGLKIQPAGRETPVPSYLKDGTPMARPGENKVVRYSGGRASGIYAANASIDDVAKALGATLKTGVIDQTGLVDRFTFQLHFLNPSRILSQATPETANLLDLFTALREQLGLRLEPRRTLAGTFVVDEAARTPAPN